MTLIRQSLGALPIVDDEIKAAAGNSLSSAYYYYHFSNLSFFFQGEEKTDEDTQMAAKVKQLVTADGTYATQSAFR